MLDLILAKEISQKSHVELEYWIIVKFGARKLIQVPSRPNIRWIDQLENTSKIYIIINMLVISLYPQMIAPIKVNNAE